MSLNLIASCLPLFATTFDFLQVFNGINPNSPSLSGRRCGGEKPPPYRATGNTMRVVFSTDSSVSNGGFLATYDSKEERGLSFFK